MIMNISDDLKQTAFSNPTEPYVGLRPFERSESHLFIGRKQDANFLIDKIFSAPITLFYGQSGLGKTSVLRALAIPQLEKDNALVVYFDNWSNEQPINSIKSRLAKLASNFGVPEVSRGDPTLTQLIGLIRSADDRSVVLIFDQFEELLVSHSEHTGLIKKELAALIRTSRLDSHVVLSLREEFLAALEPFRDEIFNLFQSTYRLEKLDGIAIRDAIRLPTEFFNVSYENKLIDRLVDDLQIQDSPSDDGEMTTDCDLPMLQLVCKQLWNTSRKKNESTLTLDRYEKLGGADKILATYVEERMPKGWSAKCFTAKLLKFLAPPSGLKISFSVNDLAALTELNKNRIRNELKRMSAERILQSREYLAERRFELQHDSFIKFLSPWRDDILFRIQQLRQIKWIFGILLLIGGLFAGGFYFQYRFEQKEIYKNTEGPLAELRGLNPEDRAKLVESRLDNATAFMLWRRTGSERLRELRDLLIRHKDLLPSWYGVGRSGLEFIIHPDSAIDWPLSLHYSSDRELDQELFALTWQMMAKSFAESWGIPVPKRIKLKTEPTFPNKLIRLTGNGIEPVESTFPTYENKAFITEKKMPKATLEFLEIFKNEWILIDQIKHGGPWWVVPRWSLPVWKVSGHLGTDGSGLLAFFLANHLVDHPEPLFSSQVIEILLNRVSKKYPKIVEEVRAARGERLKQDLIEIVRRNYSLKYLPLLLDSITRYPSELSKDVAKMAIDDLNNNRINLPLFVHGPWDSGIKISKQPNNEVKGERNPLSEDVVTDFEINEAYHEVLDWLPPVEPLIRIYIGKAIESLWFKDNKLVSQLEENLETFRQEFYRRFGIELPGVKFRHSSSDAKFEDNSFRIEMVNQSELNDLAQPISVKPEESINRFTQALSFRAKLLRAHWIGPDTVYRIYEECNPELQSWLDVKYSLTDLELLLQGVVNPTPQESEYLDKFSETDIISIPQDHTIIYPEWLLGSLIFWAEIENYKNVDLMISRLRQIQQARLSPIRDNSSKSQINSDVDQGAMALIEGKIKEARTAFHRAIKQNRSEAITSFLLTYPKHWKNLKRKDIQKECQDLDWVVLDRGQQVTLEDMISEAGPNVAEDTLRRRQLCLYSDTSHKMVQSQKKKSKDILNKYHNPEDWPAEDAYWFALKLLSKYDPITPDRQYLDSAQNLIKSAIVRLDAEKSFKAYVGIIDICNERGPKNWCWELLNEVADNRPDIDILIELAINLSYKEKATDLKNALNIAERALKKLKATKLSAKNRKIKADYLNFSRGVAYGQLAILEGGDNWTRAEGIMQQLLNSNTIGEYAHEQLISINIDFGNIRKAEEMLEDALKKWPNFVGLYNSKFKINLIKLDPSALDNTGTEYIEKAGKTKDALFIASLCQILTGRGNWELTAREFLATNHDFVDYITMMLYSFLGGRAKAEAKLLLDRRWAKIDPGTWEDRLQGGDPRAWREMLIGFYLGEVSRSKIFGELSSETRFNNSNFRYIPISRQGLLCEANYYDAMLWQAKGRDEDMRASLKRVIETNYVAYYEYKMAKYLLSVSQDN